MLPLSSPTEVRDIPHCNLHRAGALRDRGGPHPRYVFRIGRGLYAAQTPSDSRSDWTSESVVQQY